MLSFLYHLVHNYERTHGYAPNLLYINSQHFEVLKQQLGEIQNLDKMSHFLGMDIVFSEEATHPHVVWHPIEWKKASA